MSLIVLKKIIEMFIILLVGVIIYKAKIINDVSTKHLSNVLLLLVSPLLIIQSYQIDFNRELLQGLIWAFAASFLTFLFMIVASEFLCHGDMKAKFSGEDCSVLFEFWIYWYSFN